jgi:CTP:molybdopterin cytidylyltransferase MocA
MIPGIVLAAGASSRMGRIKALLPLGAPGECFVSRIVATLRAAGLEEILTVVGRDADAIEHAIARMRLAVRTVRNPHPERGQLSSLQCALATVDRPGVRAILIVPVDVPLVASSTVSAVLAAYRETGAPIVRPAHGGRHGHPVTFDRAVFDDLRRADPAAGAREVIRAHLRHVVDVEVDDEAAFEDVDTPEEYERAVARAGKPGGLRTP